MKNQNYILNFSNNDIPLQVLSMKDSYYIYIGNSNMTFDNLVMSIPTLLVFDKGEVVKTSVGFKSMEELKEFLEI
jgi:thiol-disulfide isomerase/thioredoxin